MQFFFSQQTVHLKTLLKWYILCYVYFTTIAEKQDKYFNFSLFPGDPKKISHLARLDGHVSPSLRKAVWDKLAEGYRVHE